MCIIQEDRYGYLRISTLISLNVCNANINQMIETSFKSWFNLLVNCYLKI